MKLYADQRDRLLRQIVFDVCVLVWIILWWRLGVRVHDATASGQDGTRKLESGATDLSTRMTDAGDALTNVPIVGGTLRKPFTSAAEAATQVSLAGHDLTIGVGKLATLLGYLVASTPIALAVLVWCLIRLRYARRAGRAARLVSTPAGRDVLALQALNTAPLRSLQEVSDEPAAAWRGGDTDTITRLAAIQTRALGLRPPRPRDGANSRREGDDRAQEVEDGRPDDDDI